MQDCFKEHPDVYKDDKDLDEEVANEKGSKERSEKKSIEDNDDEEGTVDEVK